jgi:hypothetical protein
MRQRFLYRHFQTRKELFMRHPPKWLSFALLLLASTTSNATYNANINGIVTEVVVYPDTDVLLFRIANQPTSHPQCDPAYFEVASSTPEGRRNQIFALLLASKAAGTPVTIGYDNAGNCLSTYIRVHRVG